MNLTKQNNRNKKISNELKRFLKFLALIWMASLISIFEYWATNLGQVRPFVVIQPVLVILLITLSLFVVFLIILRNLPKATLVMLLVIGLFFSYGHVINLLSDKNLLSGRFTSMHILIIYALIFLLGIIFCLYVRKIPANLFTFFQIFIGFIFIFNIIHIILFDPRITAKTKAPEILVNDTIMLNNKPDIYYIVLDAYARDDVLQQLYGFDNSDFLNALRSRGFYIPDCAWSNYDRTYDTIPSVLNSNYLNNLGIPDSALLNLSESQIDLILNNQIRKTFSSLGYKFVSTRGYGSFNDILDADIYLNYYNSQGRKDELGDRFFDFLFLGTTLIRATSEFQYVSSKSSSVDSSIFQAIMIDKTSLGYEESEFWYNQTNYVFDSLAELPEGSENYLVYAHINAPHGPYVYNRDGSFRFEPDLTNENSYYVDAIIYLNQRVLDLIDNIIEKSDTPPIIILQSDHGTHYYDTGINKHKILSAYYLPGNIDLMPYATITPVNDFRLVLHDYYDPSIQLLPDILYVMQEDGYQAEPASCDLQQ